LLLSFEDAKMSDVNAWVWTWCGAMSAGDWKKKYAAPASPAQMEQFTANQHLHAKHDKLPESPARP